MSKNLFERATASRLAIKAAQLADAVRDALAQPVQRLTRDCIVSITNVTLSDDKSLATVWIRVFPVERAGQVLHTLRKSAGYLQSELNRALPRRMVPRILFRLDGSIEAEEALDALLTR